MTTTREAALEAALKLARNRLQACAIDYPTGSREMAERSEWADEATAALSTPATEPQGYVEGMREAARIVDERYAAGEMGNPGHHIIQALAARPAPQPAADTRVVTDAMIVKIWGLAQQYDPDEMFIELVRAIIGTATPAQTYQSRVKPWLDACFGPEIAGDKTERNHRFLEEALELVQSGGCTASEAHQLVDYVYGRPVGEMGQEIGGVMNTLAALCLAYGRDMHEDGETELARVWTKVEKIRAKQAAKPKHSPLPEHTPAPSDKTAEAARDCRPENYASGVQCQTCGQSWGEDGPEQCPNAALAGKGE